MGRTLLHTSCPRSSDCDACHFALRVKLSTSLHMASAHREVCVAARDSAVPEPVMSPSVLTDRSGEEDTGGRALSQVEEHSLGWKEGVTHARCLT